VFTILTFLSSEAWSNAVVQTQTGCPTFTPEEQIPERPTMLDLACGYGHWCILAARYFKVNSLISPVHRFLTLFQECHIIGLDLADIQPDLRRLGYADLAEKISWVHTDM
jgi:ubiquinone/menaquinone biosynthesis C-methylase UbiE